MLKRVINTKITIFKSGPLGEGQQVRSVISEGKIDFLMFFLDPLESEANYPDVKALLRMAVV